MPRCLRAPDSARGRVEHRGRRLRLRHRQRHHRSGRLFLEPRRQDEKRRCTIAQAELLDRCWFNSADSLLIVSSGSVGAASARARSIVSGTVCFAPTWALNSSRRRGATGRTLTGYSSTPSALLNVAMDSWCRSPSAASRPKCRTAAARCSRSHPLLPRTPPTSKKRWVTVTARAARDLRCEWLACRAPARPPDLPPPGPPPAGRT